MDKPCCPCCRNPIDLAAFCFPETNNNPSKRRGAHEILNRDSRLLNKSLLGKETDRALGCSSSYAETFEQFVQSALMAPLFGLKEDPAIPANVRAIFDIAANLVLYSWFVRDFAAVGILVGYVALEAALRDASKTNKLLRPLINEELDQEALKEDIKRDTLIRIFMGDVCFAREHGDQLVQDHLDEWERQVSDAAQLRNALAHGDPELMCETTCDEAGRRLQFIGEMINRVCGDCSRYMRTR